MNKEFIPYEQALELKELGFDEPCFGFYTYKGEIRRYTNFDGELNDFQSIKNSHIKMGDDWCTALTFSQAFRWLLEKHNLYGIIIPTVTMAWTFKTMTVVIGMVEVPPYSHVDAYDYSSREEAELECLKKLIELVKNK
jgi:hypothetical protein